MKIICAPDSFKGTATAMDVASAMVRGVASMDRGDVEGLACPIADGGEGTAEVIAAVSGGTWVTVEDVVAPCGDLVRGRYLLDEVHRRAVVELATVSGLGCVLDAASRVLDRTTYGTGQLILHAMEHGRGVLDSILVGVGGSGTCDGGLGLVQALGAEMCDASGRAIHVPATARDGDRVASVSAVETVLPIRVAADVTNPLLGSGGAARVYGPQKGASPAEVEVLDGILAHLAGLAGLSGAEEQFGAAGGAAFGLHAWAGASIESGIDVVLDGIGFDGLLEGADLVLTGEGCFDEQSAFGKAVGGVMDRAFARGIPVGVIAGSIGSGADLSRCAGWVSLVEECGSERARSETASCVASSAAMLASRILG